MKMINEFKKFAIKGNMVDMAVGIIIGLAFGKIVSSFVNDVLMPPLGILLGGMDFTALVYTIKEAVGEEAAVTINYGNFIQSTLDFIIVAFAAFMMIKAMNRLTRKEEAKPAAPPKPTIDQELLAEIRDLLKKDQV